RLRAALSVEHEEVLQGHGHVDGVADNGHDSAALVCVEDGLVREETRGSVPVGSVEAADEAERFVDECDLRKGQKTDGLRGQASANAGDFDGATAWGCINGWLNGSEDIRAIVWSRSTGKQRNHVDVHGRSV